MQNELTIQQKQIARGKMILALAYVLAFETLRYVFMGAEYLP